MANVTLNGTFVGDDGKNYTLSINAAVVPVTAPVQNTTPNTTSNTAPVQNTTPTPVPNTAPNTTPNTVPTSNTSSIPLSFNALQFANNQTASSTTVASGGVIQNKKITATGSTASIVTQNGATIKNCAVDSRESVRIGGGGLFIIDGCYLEATGQGDDHADVIQAYSPGDKGTLRITNTAIVAHNTAATAGLFIADNWTGTIDLENVVFWGGPYGCRIHPDSGGDNTVKFKNVFFVGPFVYNGCWVDDRTIGGHKNKITLWENVREATIENGVLVPGKVIPKPF